MKTILERIRKYLGSTGMLNHECAQPEPAELAPKRTFGVRTSYEDPYAEMRRVLATAMLLG